MLGDGLSRRLRIVGVVGVVVFVVVSGVMSAAVLTMPRGVQPAPAYPNAGDILPQRADAAGEVTVADASQPGVVVIDAAHGNRFSPDEIRPLLAALADAGYDVRFLGAADDLDRRLSEADAFIVIDPASQYTAAEAERVALFVRHGGRLVMLAEPTRVDLQLSPFGVVPVRRHSRLGTLASAVGVEVGSEYLYNLRTNEGNYKRVYAEGALGRAALYTATRVQARGGERLLVATDGTRLSGSAAEGTYPVAVTRGNVLAVGDTTFLSGGKHTVAENEALVERITTFLTTGQRDRPLTAYPYVVGRNATVQYTDAALLNATQRVTRDLRQAGRNPVVQGGGSPTPSNATVLVTTFDYLASNDVGTGITVKGSEVVVDGHRVPRENLTVVRAPASGYDLVIATDDRDTMDRTVGVIVDGRLDRFVLSDRLALLRTGSARGSGSSGAGSVDRRLPPRRP